MREICFQKEMRDREAVAEPREPDRDIDYTVEPIGAEEATAFIKRYEWLGTVGPYQTARYCARNEFNEVAAVALFSRPNLQSTLLCRDSVEYTLTRCTGDRAGALTGKKKKASIILSDDDKAYIEKVACLERGACAHWAHPHTASWFIPKVLELANKEHRWEIFYAYSDESAGEIGTIYQACNWLYIGKGSGRKKAGGEERERWTFMHPVHTKGVFVTSRTMYGEHGWFKKLGITLKQVRDGHDGWVYKETPPKHRYVQFVGDKATRRKWRKALRYPTLPYPKR